MTDPPNAAQNGNNVQVVMAKTRIAPDLLNAMAKKTDVMAANAAAPEAKPEAVLWPAVVEMNAAFPHGPKVARPCCYGNS